MLEYHPRNHYANDFTVIEKEGLFHLFHIIGERLKFSRFLTDLPCQGHAVSPDLIQWQEQPARIPIGEACSCVEHKGRYALVSKVNQICWSDDLYEWSAPEPIFFDFDQNKDLYETSVNPKQGWYDGHRDPNIWWDKENKTYLMFFCSRAARGDIHTRGCVGAAESADLVHWKLLPPVLAPGNHFYPESPHVVDLDGKYHMFFSLSPENGLRHAVADTLRGPYQEVEVLDIVPSYVSASEAIKINGQWKFLGRLQDRVERSNQSRVGPRALCLPLGIEARKDGSVFFTACPELKKMRGQILFHSDKHKTAEHWQALSGDWRITADPMLAANEHQEIPPNSLFGSSNVTPAVVSFTKKISDFDLEFDFQLPTFSGNDAQCRGGFTVDGLTFRVDAWSKALYCQDHTKDIIALKTLPLFKCDKHYRFRIFRRAEITQVYLDGELLMYLPAYGDGSHTIGFMVDHNNLIIKDIRLWKLKGEDYAGFTSESGEGGIVNGLSY